MIITIDNYYIKYFCYFFNDRSQILSYRAGLYPGTGLKYKTQIEKIEDFIRGLKNVPKANNSGKKLVCRVRFKPDEVESIKDITNLRYDYHIVFLEVEIDSPKEIDEFCKKYSLATNYFRTDLTFVIKSDIVPKFQKLFGVFRFLIESGNKKLTQSYKNKILYNMSLDTEDGLEGSGYRIIPTPKIMEEIGLDKFTKNELINLYEPYII